MDNTKMNDNGLIDINEEDMDSREKPKVTYICGGCGKDNKLDKDSVIRCTHCGHRIFYKKRERKLLQYEAR
ncbi:dna-directed rna polymerases and iii subunit rpabc4-like [Stylonychia lemnae]|uniref:Dna-directed rna polymerases and iii subunit rpabc4-like n=1 Tax=Stylonychia lemnae TaxID=5949 RepID=A0A077ZWV5_STYLE|nr:dna-directed rna polymerases and iii subunit rpabc4-like [Stylonychia lemnae]|eukprot:CDW74081.1 dna-directed rna polymerases and iii subunit rpabc4-like [Stylonychia lemnae]